MSRFVGCTPELNTLDRHEPACRPCRAPRDRRRASLSAADRRGPPWPGSTRRPSAPGCLRDAVARCSRAEVWGSEISMPVDERVAQGEVLRHADQSVVDRAVAVRVVLAHHLTGDPRALHVGAVGARAEDVHAPEDPAVHRLESVARVGQRPRRDDRHGVVEEGALHLLLDLDGLDLRSVERWVRHSSDVEEPHVLGVGHDELLAATRRRRP